MPKKDKSQSSERGERGERVGLINDLLERLRKRLEAELPVIVSVALVEKKPASYKVDSSLS